MSFEKFDQVMANFYPINHNIEDKKAIEMIAPFEDFLYEKWLEYSEDEKDFRSGEETYGFDDISGTLHYISDRYGCAFRLKWLYELTQRGVE